MKFGPIVLPVHAAQLSFQFIVLIFEIDASLRIAWSNRTAGLTMALNRALTLAVLPNARKRADGMAEKTANDQPIASHQDSRSPEDRGCPMSVALLEGTALSEHG